MKDYIMQEWKKKNLLYISIMKIAENLQFYRNNFFYFKWHAKMNFFSQLSIEKRKRRKKMKTKKQRNFIIRYFINGIKKYLSELLLYIPRVHRDNIWIFSFPLIPAEKKMFSTSILEDNQCRSYTERVILKKTWIKGSRSSWVYMELLSSLFYFISIRRKIFYNSFFE